MENYEIRIPSKTPTRPQVEQELSEIKRLLRDQLRAMAVAAVTDVVALGRSQLVHRPGQSSTP